MTTRDGSNISLVMAIVAGGALWYLWQQQQQDEQDSGVATGDTYTGDIESGIQQVENQIYTAVGGATRGERNNNPGNLIKDPTQWQGLAQNQSDSKFFVFADPVYGIRALHKTLISYQTLHGLNTVADMITRYAPPQDKNNTAKYIMNVCAAMGVQPNTVIDVTDNTTAMTMIDAIINQENGRNIYAQSGQLAQGVSMA